ncbi:hypothetical protein B0H66DRAFT_575821 [Apodospora peruviana]|uniref:Uncharacterized protein n=1 Tax=Apodospora peruviana TaxID=516989 RepID=A0AAE0I6H0_9PEZI|nr:hypothetical protein B0H66DRAFT_575821 [Apodospora peruviana]
MDSSPLIKAHDHARAASLATQSADTTVAINQHALAAGEFSNAAKSTTSAEALRTLTLLEQHHRRLSELLKLPSEPPSQQSSFDGDIPEEDESESSSTGKDDGGGAKPPKPSSKTDASSAATSSPSAVKPPPTLPNPRRYPSRELSSSIASNLASARGIKSKYSRGQPLTPSVSNDQAPGSLEVHPRREGSMRNKAGTDAHNTTKPSWVPPAAQQAVTKADSASSKSESDAPSQSEEGFSRFYSTFGNLINRLSAPLAFAGLPLIAEESGSVDNITPVHSPEPAPAQKRFRNAKAGSVTTTERETAEPDLSKIYSRATLRSLARDGNDSFYVVPTSGHTATYASILNHDTKEKRRLIAASLHSNDVPEDPDEDDFVDARESQFQLPPVSPSFRKRLGPRSKSEKELQNVIEELHLENTSLKEMLDKLSKRLHAFELNSQTSHLALAQSLRLQRPGSPMSSSGGAPTPALGSGGDEALRKKNRELEEQIAGIVKQIAVLEKENEKLQTNLERYRERWDKLKAGAKARREAQDQSAGG